MTTSNTPLKPCPNPFCADSRPTIYEQPICAYFYAKCMNCAIEGHFKPTKAEAIEAWNTRTRPQVKVKPLDLSNLLKNAFISGRVSARGSSSFDTEAWVEYDPECCPAYARILSALGEQ